MLAAILALSSSFLIGITTILMKKVIERTNPTSAMLFITLVGSIIFLLISFFTIPLSYLKSESLPYFVIAGIFSPALVRWLYFISLDRIGPSVSSSIFATGPAFTAIIAIVLLDEKITIRSSLLFGSRNISVRRLADHVLLPIRWGRHYRHPPGKPASFICSGSQLFFPG